MTGFAPISNAVPPNANPAVAASFSAPSISVPRASSFSSILASAGTAYAAAKNGAPGRNAKSLGNDINAPLNLLAPQASPATIDPHIYSTLLAVTPMAPMVAPPVPTVCDGAQRYTPLTGSDKPAIAALAAAVSFGLGSVAGSAGGALPGASSLAGSMASAAALALPLDSIAMGSSAANAVIAQGGALAGILAANPTGTLAGEVLSVASQLASLAGGTAGANPKELSGIAASAGAEASGLQNRLQISAASSSTNLAAALESVARVDAGKTGPTAGAFALPKGTANQPASGETFNSGLSARSGGASASDSHNVGAETFRVAGTTASSDLQKAIADTRDTLVQQIGAHLQAVLDGAPGKAIASAAPTAGAAGNALGQAASNSTTNTSSGNSAQAGNNAGTGTPTDTSADHSSSSTEENASTASVDPAAALKSATLSMQGVLLSVHVPADAMLQTASATMLTTQATTQAIPQASSSASTARAVPAAPIPLPEALPQSLGDVVKASELYQRVGGSEMHVAMQTDLLGSVDLRATVHQSTLTATISVQRADVQALLSNELPALQHALSDRNLQVEQISVLNNPAGGRTGSGEQPQPQGHNPFLPRGASVTNAVGTSSNVADDIQAALAESSIYAGLGGGLGRISVHV